MLSSPRLSIRHDECNRDISTVIRPTSVFNAALLWLIQVGDLGHPHPWLRVECTRSSLAHSGDPAKLAAGGIRVNRLTRYWKYAVFGTLVPGVALAIVAAPKLVWNDYPDPFWKLLFSLAGILCSVGLLMWLCLAIASVGSDVTELWNKSKPGALLTFTAIALLARVLQRFTGPHFYGWHADAWLFFFMALLLGSYLLLRISVALIGARKN